MAQFYKPTTKIAPTAVFAASLDGGGTKEGSGIDGMRALQMRYIQASGQDDDGDTRMVKG